MEGEVWHVLFDSARLLIVTSAFLAVSQGFLQRGSVSIIRILCEISSVYTAVSRVLGW